MADRSVTVRLRVEDNFSAPINSYTQKMNQAEQATQKAAQGASRAGQGFAQMGTALKGAIVGVGIMGVASLAEGLYSAGMNAQRAGMLFASFGDQVGSTSALLERLRGVTRGVVDDTTLMSAASSQLSMGLAKNADDVERLTNIGVTFAQAMGTSVQDSMSNLNMLLANQSYLRLDTLGISSSQVRELAESYRKAGMDSSEAFNAAFMDVAERKLPQMQAVADAMVTPLQQMQTSLDNWWTDFGNRFAQGVNGLIGMVTHLGEVAGFVMAGLPGGGTSGVPLIDNGPGVNAVNGAMYRQFVEMQGRAGNSAFFAPYQQSAFDLAGYSPRSATSVRDLLGGRGSAAGEFEAIIRQQSSETARIAAQIAANTATEAAFRAAGITGLGSQTRWFDQQTAPFNDALGRLTSQFNSAMMGGYMGGGTGASLFTTDAVERMTGIQSAMDGILASAESMNERGIMSDADVERFRQASQWMAQTATDANAARAALDNMSLSQLFGQQSGGRTGEISGGLLSLLSAQGVDANALQGLQDALFLNSGQETAASLQFRDEVLPMLADIYTQFGTEATITALNAYNEAAAQTAAMSGLGSPVSLLAATGYSRMGGGGGGSFTAQPGDTVSALAAARGMSVGDFASQYGISDPSMIYAGQTYGSTGGGELTQVSHYAAMDDAASNISSSMADAESSASSIADDMTAAVDVLASGIEGVFGKTYQLPVELVISGAGIIGQLVAAAVTANGGATPGATGNSGRSSTPRNSNSNSSSSGYSARGGYNPP
jgi:hypothetical protein